MSAATRSTRGRRVPRRFLVGAVAGSVAAGALALAAAPAQAAGGPTITVLYDAVGSSTVRSTGSVVPLGPTTLTTVVSGDGTFTGSLPLPPQRTSFKALGLLPVTATVTFEPAGGKRQVTGTLLPGKVRSKARYYLRLSDVTVAGLPAFVGDSCRTVDPVVIPATTPKGQTFDLTNGGTLTGTYTIGQFATCGLQTPIINALIPGAGNTETITLTNGRVVSPQ
ncbi:hypothetical protein [Lapillicoccus jejuensis]|uniref:Uncharacterized protein n=1 Tax=Lapillicoccus jejuensis TaxID=402171 RepID=A0A542DX03_9MICO|nr:hypothetical protein [Lapillicoccus jejuensis]TQJ07444.1 hypothetical protein FB458_0506 [Lapillicoccus jejuensis]